MSLVATDNKHYKAIADSIRANTGTENTYAPKEMAEGVNAVYEAGKTLGDYEGYTRGLADGEASGYDKGKWDEYDMFWDGFQWNGTRTNYEHAFRGGGWNKDNLKPKYFMQPTNATQMFYWLGWEKDNAKTVDLRASAIGVEIDFSKCTRFDYCFQNAKISHLGVIDLSSFNGTLPATFCNMYWLNSIEKIIVHEGVTFHDNCFSACGASKIIFEGVIASNIKLTYSTIFTKESIESVINALSNTASGKTLALNLTAVKRAFETLSGANDGNTSEEWLTLAATKSNWTITLV